MSLSRTLQGIGVSHGVALGPALVVNPTFKDLREVPLFAADLDREEEKLKEALARTEDRLLELRKRTEQRAGSEEAKIFDAQIMMIQDEEFLATVRNLINENHITAERAFEFVSLELRELWSQSDNAALRQKTTDLSAITDRVLGHLIGKTSSAEFAGQPAESSIVIVKELTPGLTVEFDRGIVAAFVSEEGTRTSHAAILARSLEIPCVMGLRSALADIKSGDQLIVDGSDGVVVVNPSAAKIKKARSRQDLRRSLERELELGVHEPACTVDGVLMSLRGNLDLPEELDSLVGHGAEGVGLMRTEFLVLGRSELPSEEEQYRYYKRVAQRFPSHPLIIRSYDLGGDKYPAAFRAPPDPNPFLGWRAIRVCLDQPDMFKTQIRALLRARLHGDVQMMLPLVTGLDELERSQEFVREAADALQKDGVEAASDMPVGVMVETPAAVMLSGELAMQSDFLSVGTNDLTQYTLAVDRGNARLADRFLSLHPSIVRMLKRVLDAAEEASIPVSVCGELASDPLGGVLLLGLGYRVLSVVPSSLPLVRWLIRQIDEKAARLAAERALSASTADQVTAVLSEVVAEHVDADLLSTGWLPTRPLQTTLKGLKKPRLGAQTTR